MLQSCNQGNISVHFIFKELVRYTGIESWYALNLPSLPAIPYNQQDFFFLMYYFLIEEIKSFALIKSEITNWSSL